MVTNREKTRQNHILFASFRLFLLGYPDKKIKRIGATDEMLAKCKTFKDAMIANKNCETAGMSIGVGSRTARIMKKMFLQWKQKEEITAHLRYFKQINRVPTIYSMILSGVSDYELLASGYTKDEVERAKRLDDVVKADKLYSVLSKETNIPVNTLKRLKKVFNDHQESLACPM